MKRLIIIVSIFFFLLTIPISSYATLTSLTDLNEDTVVYDDETGLYWYYDLSYFTNQTYTEVLSAIDNLNTEGYYGFSDWSIASQEVVLDLSSEFFIDDNYTLFESTGRITVNYTTEDGTIVSTEATLYGGRTESPPGSVASVDFRIFDIPVIASGEIMYGVLSGTIDGITYDYYFKNESLGAWVVSNGGAAAPVPEPSTVLLLGFGIAGLAGARRKLNK